MRPTASAGTSSLIGAALGFLALVWLQIVVEDSVYPSRYWVIERGIDEYLMLILVIASPVLSVLRVAEFSRDRAWVLVVPRAPLRAYVGRVFGATFRNGFVMFAAAMLVTMVGSYLLSFQPGIYWVSPSGAPSVPVDMSLESTQLQIYRSGAGLLTPVAGVSMFLFYPVLLLWVSIWGGVLSVFALVFVMVLPWPRIGLLVPLIWWYVSIMMLGNVNFGFGSVAVDLAMFPTMSVVQPWVAPVLATVLYLLPAVIVGVWGWRRLERLPGFS